MQRIPYTHTSGVYQPYLFMIYTQNSILINFHNEPDVFLFNRLL